MSSQLLAEYKTWMTPDHFELFKEFIQCVDSGNIFRKIDKAILCLKGDGALELLEKMWSLVDDDNKYDFNMKVKPKHTNRLVILRKYSSKYDKTIRSMVSGFMAFDCNCIPYKKLGAAECNLVYVLHDGIKVTKDIESRSYCIDLKRLAITLQ